MTPRPGPKITRPAQTRSLEGWTQCPGCKSTIPSEGYARSHRVCEQCGHHGRLSARERIEFLLDPGTFREHSAPAVCLDPLQFRDQESYRERWSCAQRKSGEEEALIWGEGQLEGIQIALAVMEFAFMGGSMGSAVGERLTECCQWALHQRAPLIVVTASGGARMQEGILSLLQMAKTAQAFERLHQAAIPVISLLTDPTCGGVTASFATLADLIFAEPGALICFTGPRVIEQNLRQRLPPGVQRAEFLLTHGMLDQIIPRSRQRESLAEFCRYLGATSAEPVRSLVGARVG